MKDALAIHRLLLEHETAHEIVRLPRPMTSADELPDVLGLPPGRCLVTHMFAFQATGGLRLTAMLSTAGECPSAAAVGRGLGVASVGPAPAGLVNRVTDYAADLVAPLLLPPEVTLFVEERTADTDGIVYTATGEARTALGIHALDLFALCDAKAITLHSPS